jgi:hypothetical protein
VMESEPWMVAGMPAPTASRMTITKKSDTEISALMEFKQGNDWVKISEGTLKKKTTH